MADDFSIKQIEMELNKLQQKMGVDKPDAQKPESAQQEFGKILKDAISEVNELTTEADEAVQKQIASGETQDLHSTMIAMQKAQVSFETMMQIRNKIVKAYEEIMRMPV
jgi:flagellar hook-basal body complex protein FliE